MFHWATQMYFHSDELNLCNTTLSTHEVTLNFFGKALIFKYTIIA